MSPPPNEANRERQLPIVQQVISILWPSFLTAAAATIVIFTLIDPSELGMIAGIEGVTRLGGYTIGFFAFWLLTASSSALTCYFRNPCPSQRKIGAHH